MTTSKSLPARPSEESLRKQAKRLARDVAAGNTDALTRARAQLPQVNLPLSRRDAQLVLAREYGFTGWPQLLAEVQKRVGDDLEAAVAQARQIIHANDVARLKQLLAEHPALLSWHGEKDDGGLLGMAANSFSDSGDPERERTFTRADCAEALIDAGAVVVPSVCDGLVESRTNGLLRLFERKGLLPQTLKFRVALGDVEAVRACIERGAADLAAVNEALGYACHFENEALATMLLDRSIALDAALGARIDEGPGRSAFIKGRIEERGTLAFMHVGPADPWQTFLMQQVVRALHDNDLASFVRGLERDPWLLGDLRVGWQIGMIERAILRDRPAFIAALLDRNPALVRVRPPPASQAIEFALTYVKPHLLPLLTRVWPLPDDLPHAAGTGNLERVKQWFDASGKPAQQTLDTALAWSVLNHHFDVADFLLAHGADINTRWGSHEPASILHELVFHADYDGMQFLIDRGIDMTIVDHRWGSTAQGWALYAAKDEKMAQWLGEAMDRRKS